MIGFGVVMLAVCMICLAVALYQNVRHTNLGIGALMTTVQVVAMPIIVVTALLLISSMAKAAKRAGVYR